MYNFLPGGYPLFRCFSVIESTFSVEMESPTRCRWRACLSDTAQGPSDVSNLHLFR